MHIQLHDLVAATAARRGDGPALTYRDSTLSYGQLWREITAVAAGLRRAGLRRRERVAVYLDKRIETVTAMVGAGAAGGVFVPVSPLLRPRQVGYILTDCDARILVTTAERFELLRDDLDECKSVELVVLLGAAERRPASEAAAPSYTGDVHRVPLLRKTHYDLITWGELIADTEPAAGPTPGGGIDLDMAAIFYTSGSTGRPKGVVLSHRNLVVGAQSVSHYLANVADDVILAALPLSFDAGFSQLTTGFCAGAHVVLMNYLVPGDVVRLCEKHAVTGLTCVPPLWIQLVDQSWPAAATQNLRYFANTGGRMPKATLEKLRAIFPGARPFLMYGLTEAFRSTYLDPDEVDRRPDSIGKAIPNAEILVVRPDGSLCDPGEEGELVHRGALVAMGYWNDPERTAERFRPAPNREPGLCTDEMAVWSGDAVVRDEEGFLYFVGRKDEMIKTSGYRVSPTEIEEVVYDTGLVRDAVALGVDDPLIGQHIVLVVSAAAGTELDAAALSRQLKSVLPLYMVPREIVIRPELPRLSNGKFDRALLRRELTQ
jgi:acyl-CoA ligase (AMP-forming) (exosortase A-associated)